MVDLSMAMLNNQMVSISYMRCHPSHWRTPSVSRWLKPPTRNHQEPIEFIDVLNPSYFLVNVYITMENHHFSWENPWKMVIFNSYVSLPEGRHRSWEAQALWFSCGSNRQVIGDPNQSLLEQKANFFWPPRALRDFMGDFMGDIFMMKP